jgi:hypothetical protein
MTVTMLMIWLAVCAVTMLAVLADAACSAARANSAGFGWSPPSLSTITVTGIWHSSLAERDRTHVPVLRGVQVDPSSPNPRRRTFVSEIAGA